METVKPSQVKLESVVGDISSLINDLIIDWKIPAEYSVKKSKTKWKSNRIFQQMFSEFSDIVVNV